MMMMMRRRRKTTTVMTMAIEQEIKIGCCREKCEPHGELAEERGKTKASEEEKGAWKRRRDAQERATSLGYVSTTSSGSKREERRAELFPGIDSTSPRKRTKMNTCTIQICGKSTRF